MKQISTCMLSLMALMIGLPEVFAHEGHEHESRNGPALSNSPPALKALPPMKNSDTSNSPRSTLHRRRGAPLLQGDKRNPSENDARKFRTPPMRSYWEERRSDTRSVLQAFGRFPSKPYDTHPRNVDAFEFDRPRDLTPRSTPPWNGASSAGRLRRPCDCNCNPADPSLPRRYPLPDSRLNTISPSDKWMDRAFFGHERYDLIRTIDFPLRFSGDANL